jgi:hypothetical protein
MFIERHFSTILVIFVLLLLLSASSETSAFVQRAESKQCGGSWLHFCGAPNPIFWSCDVCDLLRFESHRQAKIMREASRKNDECSH